MMHKICRGRVDFGYKPAIIFFKTLFISDHRGRKLINRFEKEFAEYIGVKQAVAVSCAKTALSICLKALKAKADDEIIVPAYTVAEVIDVIIANKLKPVFVDISLDDANMNPELIEQAVSERTKFILMTHMHGNPCDADQISKIAEKHGLIIVEDAAQACGGEYQHKKTGSLGKVGYFSFGMLKNLNSLGGSVITSDDEQLIAKIRQ
jgi:perosamine synthetase